MADPETAPQPTPDAAEAATPPTVKSDAERQKEWDQQDAEVEAVMQTVQPHSDAPSRANITGPGSGADGGSGHHED